jgi:diguanylate cyclase (GGDEF)-like protein
MAIAPMSPPPGEGRRAPPPRPTPARRPATILPFVEPATIAPDEPDRRRRELAIAHAYILKLEARQRELMEAVARLIELATTDGLTGLRNRRHFNETLETASAHGLRRGLPLSMIMVDVDHFKQYNDAFGHRAGDEVLRVIAATLRAGVRPHDVAARYGGEEFAVLLTGTEAAGALRFSERLRGAVASHPWTLRPVTISLGVATLGPGPAPAGAYDLVEAADRALYHSKLCGRDRVTHHDELPPGRAIAIAMPAPTPAPARPAVLPLEPIPARRETRTP